MTELATNHPPHPEGRIEVLAGFTREKVATFEFCGAFFETIRNVTTNAPGL